VLRGRDDTGPLPYPPRERGRPALFFVCGRDARAPREGRVGPLALGRRNLTLKDALS